jgi:LacI family transcriptional regulator
VFQDAIEGVEEVVCDHHYSLLLCNSRRNLELQAAHVRRLLERRVEGLILFSIPGPSRELETLQQAQLPVLIADGTGSSLNVPNMSVNLQVGIQSGLEYLSRLGHRRIAFIAPRAQPHSQRAEIYRQAMLGLGIPYDPSLVVFAGSNAECREGVSALLDRTDRPTALFVSAGIFAPHALTRIYEAGVEIPSDLSFITVGETPWAAAHRPPLTTISHDAVGWGRMAGEYIFARIAGNDGSAVVHEVQSELIIRASCAPWRGR